MDFLLESKVKYIAITLKPHEKNAWNNFLRIKRNTQSVNNIDLVVIM